MTESLANNLFRKTGKEVVVNTSIQRRGNVNVLICDRGIHGYLDYADGDQEQYQKVVEQAMSILDSNECKFCRYWCSLRELVSGMGEIGVTEYA